MGLPLRIWRAINGEIPFVGFSIALLRWINLVLILGHSPLPQNMTLLILV
jgi:hypothetical protein